MALKQMKAGRSKEKSGRTKMTPVMRHRNSSQTDADYPALETNDSVRPAMDVVHQLGSGKQITTTTPFGTKA